MSEDFLVQLAGLRAGSVLAGYRLEAKVGAGGMAVVFRARDQRLGRLVALKVLTPAIAADGMFRRRFIAESRAAAAVDDPHIIPVYEAGEADGVLFIAMRFVMGGDLRRVLEREGPLAPDRVTEFISPVASALDAAHGAGLVHRDVKPANILVDARPGRPDHVYLSDFGVSKGAGSSVSLTAAGQFLGTPDYSAPEQIQGLAIDGRADQYALACVAYQLLTGAVPFERDQGMAVLLAHLSVPPPSLGSRHPGLPGAADAVLARGLAKVPEKRYGSCLEFAGALREALGQAPYHLRKPDPAPAPAPAPVNPSRGQETVSGRHLNQSRVTADGQRPVRSRPGRRAGLVWTAGILALVLVAVVVFVLVLPGIGRTPTGAAGSAATRHSTGSAPASSGSARASAGTPARSFSVSPGPRLFAPGAADPGSVSFSPDGKKLFDTYGYVWNLSSLAYTPLPSRSYFNWAGFSPSGTTLAAVSAAGAGAIVWDAKTSTVAATLYDADNTYTNSAAYSPDGTMLAVGADSGKVYVWNVRQQALITTLPLRGTPSALSLAFSPDGKKLAVSEGDNTYVWDLATHAVVATMPDPEPQVAFSPDGKTLVIGDELWNATTYTRIAALSSKACDGVLGVAFSPDGSEVAIATGTSTCVWDVAEHRLLKAITDPGGKGATAVAFSSHGGLLATGDDGGSIYLWHVR